jgi:hypothetical protein
MIKTEVCPARRLAVHSVDGELTLNGMLDAMRGLYANPDFGLDFGVVWDLQKNDLAITLREIIYLDPMIVQLANEYRSTGKVAWVPATGFGRSAIALLYREHSWAQEWQTFLTLDAAIRWASADDE